MVGKIHFDSEILQNLAEFSVNFCRELLIIYGKTMRDNDKP